MRRPAVRVASAAKWMTTSPECRLSCERQARAIGGRHRGSIVDQTEYSIRRAMLSDATALARVHEATWRETYIGLMSEQMLDALTADARTAAWTRILSGQTGYLATT